MVMMLNHPTKYLLLKRSNRQDDSPSRSSKSAKVVKGDPRISKEHLQAAKNDNIFIDFLTLRCEVELMFFVLRFKSGSL